MLLNLRDSFSDFLSEKHAENKAYPESLEALRDGGGIKLVLSDTKDPEHAGFVQWNT